MEWYYRKNGSSVGPLDEGAFHELVKTGKIRAETLVWNSNMEGWERLKNAGIQLNEGDQAECTEENCSQCGNYFPKEDMITFDNIWVCASCKPVFVQKLKEGVNVSGILEYAGFWIRLGAKMIDGLILWLTQVLFSLFVAFIIGLLPKHMATGAPVIIFIFQIVINGAYVTWFLGRYGATPGKMACKLRVVSSAGEKITYSRALGRFLAEMLSGLILCIGYIMAAFDEEKRTLHDRLCDTRVIKN